MVSHAEWREQTLDALRSISGCEVLLDDVSRANGAEDFGHIVHGSPRAIARPRSSEELASVVSFAYENGLHLTPRGGGNSQGGQSVTIDGVTLDFSALTKVESVEASSGTIVCEAGAHWREVLAASAAQGFMPCSMPLNLDLTVGGTLSVGGIGDTAHRLGPSVANVDKLAVITGTGRAAECSRHQDPDLFHATLAGLGRCAVITRATLKLRPLPQSVRKFYLLYDSVDAWLADQNALSMPGRCDYLEAFCSASIQGLKRTPRGRAPFAQWFYCLHVAFESDNEKAPEASEALAGLHPYRVVHVEDDDVVSYAARMDGRFAMMRNTGSDRLPHPWFECFVPAEALPELVPRLLDLLPLSLGDGHRVFFLDRAQLPRFFMVPDSARVAGFAVLPVGIPPAFIEGARKAILEAQGVILASGGKRYLSGWLGTMQSSNWRAHFGPRYDEWMSAKRAFDPGGVFDSSLFRSDASDG